MSAHRSKADPIGKIDKVIESGCGDMQDLCNRIIGTAAIHHKMFQILLRKGQMPLGLAEALEDAGNIYLDMSERISEYYLCKKSNIE